MNARETGVVQLVALISMASNGRRWYTFQEEVAQLSPRRQSRRTEVARGGRNLVDGERNRQPSRLFFPIAITRIVYRH